MATIQRHSAKYGKLWPLQTFNACNPLVASEHLPFPQALKEASLDSGFSISQAQDVFRRLFQKQVFSVADVERVLDAAESEGGLDGRIDLGNHAIRYRQLVCEEILTLLSDRQAPPVSDATQTQLISVLTETVPPHSLAEPEPLAPVKSRWIHEQVTKWLAAYLDEGQAIWAMPNQKLPLRTSWARLTLHDNSMPSAMRKSLRARAKRLILDAEAPDSAIGSLEKLCQEVGLSAEEQERLIQFHLKQMPGWVGYIQYRQTQNPMHQELLVDYLLICFLYHCACVEADWPRAASQESNSPVFGPVQRYAARMGVIAQTAFFQTHSLSRGEQGVIEQIPALLAYCDAVDEFQVLTLMMRALEFSQNRDLLARLTQQFRQPKQTGNAVHMHPDAQAVFCIDVRSEPYRKFLESCGNIETYGFAGFFGLPIEKISYASHEPVPLCPILLEPQYTIPESPSPFLEKNPIGQWLRQGIPLRNQWIYALKKIKRDTFATFSYVESFGLVHAATLLKDTFWATSVGKLRQSVVNTLNPLLGLMPKLEVQPCSQSHLNIGMAIPEQVEMAKGILKLLGFRQPFAEFVIICGHNARSRNNPYASALDCGACGANGGGYNALVLCQILNHPDVREALILAGWAIPEHTRFVAAEHNTTTDEVIFLNEDVIPNQQQQRFLALKKVFEQATRLNSLNRQTRFSTPGFRPDAFKAQELSFDWSQTRPEWGLSRNQAFVICNRESIKSLDLEGRCFLHSYDWQSDADASILTTIMTAPMVVGAWINLQYNFSTLNQHRFGSGKKYLHNVVGLFGTYIGNGSDLQLGLPYESLFDNDGTPYHYPQRLMVCVEAPLARVEAIVAAHASVRNLVENQWIHLMVFDPDSGKTFQWTEKGWTALQSLQFQAA
jgi:uncharacterized protein YbcC (UPF0753/DUF2309 family)